ncbi:MAG: signal peptidase II [Anaerolineae bacterium]
MHPKAYRLLELAVLIGLTGILVYLDQMTKALVRQNLAVGQMWAPIPALSRVFTFTHVQNTGVAFGQMTGLGWLFLAVNLAVLIGILVYYPRIPAGQWSLRLAAALILAGDLGNVLDRLRTMIRFVQDSGSVWQALPRAYVTDFLDFKIWPVFNMADLWVVTGVIILAFTLWRTEQMERARQVAVNDESNQRPASEPWGGDPD